MNLRRREFITVLGGAAAWPLAARAQHRAMPVIGYLGPASAGTTRVDLDEFRQGLADAGFVEGHNVTVEYRWAEGRNDRLPALAAELVARQVTVIVVSSNAGGLVAKAATSIPIVFMMGGDPVKFGFVASLNRPGGNLTGVVGLTDVLIKKRLELLHELVPHAAAIAVLLNPSNPDIDTRLRDVQAAAQAIGQEIHVLMASTPGEIDTAFATLAERRFGALLVQDDPFLSDQRRQRIIALAAHHRVPAGFEQRSIVEAGGLMSYGASRTERYRQVGVYTGRIIKGEKPADLPVVQPTKFELVLNLIVAKALGLTVPPTLLAIADEVIE
jgi:putative ABC transport system substrate-binding protein